MARFVVVYGDHPLPTDSSESAVFYQRGDDWFLSFTYQIASLPDVPGAFFFEEEQVFRVGPPRPLLMAAGSDSRGRLVCFSSHVGLWVAPLTCAIDARNVERLIARIGGQIIKGSGRYYSRPL